MGKSRVYTDSWYTMPKGWRHTRDSANPDDRSLTIKDEHYSSGPTYCTKFAWEQLKDDGVLTVTLVLSANGRTDREVADDAVASAREVWEVRKHIAVAESQGNNGQCDLFLSFRLPQLPPIEEVERLYRLIKQL